MLDRIELFCATKEVSACILQGSTKTYLVRKMNFKGIFFVVVVLSVIHKAKPAESEM